MLIKPVQVWDRKLRKVNHCPIFLNLPILDPQPYFNQPSYPDLPLYLHSTFLSSTHCPISLYLPILFHSPSFPISTHWPISLNFPILDPLSYLPPTFLSSTHLPIPPPTFLSSTHCPISLNFSIINPRPIPNLPILDPLTYLPPTFLSSTHCPTYLSSPLSYLPPTFLSSTHCPTCPISYGASLPIFDQLHCPISPHDLPILDPLPDLAQLTYLWPMALYSWSFSTNVLLYSFFRHET